MTTANVTATLFDLPLYDILFLKIFSYLDAWEVWRIRTVSTRFCRICWKYFRRSLATLCVDLTTFGSEEATFSSVLVKLAVAKDIIRVSTQLKMFSVHTDLSISHLLGKGDIESMLKSVADAAPQLKHLCITNLESQQLSPFVAKGLGKCCSQLIELILWNINPEGTSFDVILLSILDRPIPTLAKLSLNSVKFCEKDTLCKCALNITNLRNFTANNLTIDDQVYGEIFKSLPKLEVVDLRYSFCIQERTIRILVEFCSLLKKLYLDQTNLAHSMSPDLMKSIQVNKIHVDIPLLVNSTASHRILGQI